MTGNPDGTLSLDDAVDRWMAEAPADDQGAEEIDAEPESDEDNPDAVEVEAAGDDDDEGNDDLEAEEGDEDDDPEFEIDTPKGQARVKLSELRAGYLRQSDYTRKTMEVAEQRRQIEAEQTEAAQLKQQLSEALQVWAVPTEQEPNWAEMAQKLDPREFNARRVQWEQRQQAKEQARQQYHALQAYERQQTEAREKQALLDAVPEWRDAERFKSDAMRMATGAEAYGLSRDDLSNVMDHRLLLVLRDAVAYREMMAKQPAAAKRVAKPNKALKPGSKPNKAANSEAVRQKQMNRLKQTGRVEDAVDLLFQG